MGVPYFEIRDLCKKHSVTIFSSNFALYRDISSRIFSIVKQEVLGMEVYSIDEAFFDAKEDIDLDALRKKILKEVGIPVSIGVGVTKTRAKIASLHAKKDPKGIYVVTDNVWDEIAPNTPVGSIWGVGRELSQKLNSSQIYTALEYVRANSNLIKNVFGVVGLRIQAELQGYPAYDLSSLNNQNLRQSYTSSRSFGSKISHIIELQSALGHHIGHVSEKLRVNGCGTLSMTVYLRKDKRDADSSRSESIKITLPSITQSSRILTHEGMQLLRRLYQRGVSYTKIGVSLGSIYPVEESTLSFLFKDATATEKIIDTVGDALNKRFGKRTVALGVTLGGGAWNARHLYTSPLYTTQWTDIKKVH